MSYRTDAVAAPSTETRESLAAPAPHELGAAAVAKAIRRGDISAEAHATLLLGRARTHADLKSFITIDEASVLESARAADLARAAGRSLPLLGVPMGIKDSYMTRGLRTSFGTAVLKDFVPTRDAAVVGAIRDAGAILFGKNNLVEMSYGLTGANPHHGQVKNPYDRTRITGGSSSGSAASVAARIVPASLGGDTVGSIRVPASLTSVVGYKPTPGRWPGEGIAPISHTLDTPGLLARNVDDCILLEHVVAGGPSPSDIGASGDLRGIRIAYAPRQYLDGIDEEVEAGFRATLLRLKSAGAELVEVDLGDDFHALAQRATWTLFARETRPAIVEFLQRHAVPASFEDILDQLDPHIRRGWDHLVLPGGEGYSPDEAYNDALNRDRPELQGRFRGVFARADFLILPTTPFPAPAIAEQRHFVAGGREATDLALANHTIPASLAGLPGISLPAGLSRGELPFGLEIEAAPGQDVELLAVARRVEAVLGSVPPPPGI